MPRNPDRRQQLPSIAAKIGSIKGLRPGEKALLVRIGNLVDAAVVAERGLANPRSNPGRRISSRVPIPQNVTALDLLDGVQLKWDPVDFNEFESYEVQIDTSSAFPNPTVSFTGLDTFNIRDTTNQGLFTRVRTISRRGVASEFTSTITITVPNNVYEVDSDALAPENRTTVNPQPRLLGAVIDVVAGERAFVGVGAAVGPSPLTLTDLAGEPAGTPDLRHQITYVLEENSQTQEQKKAGIPTFLDEKLDTNFYPGGGEPGFYLNISGRRKFNVFSGSITDFFNNHIYNFTPSQLDVRLLSYIGNPHEQAGVIVDATDGIIKH